MIKIVTKAVRIIVFVSWMAVSFVTSAVCCILILMESDTKSSIHESVVDDFLHLYALHLICVFVFNGSKCDWIRVFKGRSRHLFDFVVCLLFLLDING